MAILRTQDSLIRILFNPDKFSGNTAARDIGVSLDSYVNYCKFRISINAHCKLISLLFAMLRYQYAAIVILNHLQSFTNICCLKNIGLLFFYFCDILLAKNVVGSAQTDKRTVSASLLVGVYDLYPQFIALKAHDAFN